jgi:prepilin-type N-terminal cleavage/methylation domain-containing protein
MEYRMSNNENRNKARLKPWKGTSGFTLLEVLVALALLGIAVTAVLQLFSANLKSILASEEYVSGSLEAQSKMREVLDSQEFSERSWNGITDNGYRFQVSVSDTLPERVENLHVKLVVVEVKVYWARGSGEKSLTLKTMKMVEKPI